MKKSYKIILSAIVLVAIGTFIFISCNEKEIEKSEINPKPIFAHFGDVIGEVQGNDYVVTCNETRLAENWNEVLDDNGVTADLSGFEIVYISDEDIYLLLGYDNNEGLTAGIQLELEGDYFYEVNGASGGSGSGGGGGSSGLTVSCQSSECFVPDCQPRIKGDNAWCTFCLHQCIQTSGRTNAAIY